MLYASGIQACKPNPIIFSTFSPFNPQFPFPRKLLKPISFAPNLDVRIPIQFDQVAQMLAKCHIVEGLLMEEDASKIRKRGCSPSSPSSSILHNYRFKKAVLLGKRGGGSSTPVPSWRRSLRMAAADPPRSQSGRSKVQIPQPVSARKLAATLWELNEVPVAAPAVGRRRRVDSAVSGSLPPHLSDPSHSPVSERTDRSKSRTHRRRQSSSVSRRLNNNAVDVGVLDSVSNASFMEIETRSRCQSQTPAGSTAGGYRSYLKDVSNALTTSKELLKIICRMWGQQDYQPSTSMSLISALHTELERARLHVNQLVQEQRSDQNEINYLVKCFAEEKAAWKNKEKQSIKAAIESAVGELEVERKLRRRVESLNKKLGKELAEIKAALFSNPKAEEENETAEQLRDELEDFLRDERGKEKAHHASINHTSFGFNPSDEKEVEDLVKFGDDSAESDLHSIEMNVNRISKGHKSRFASAAPRNVKKLMADDEQMGRGLRRSTSNVVNCGEYGERLQFEKQGHRRSCGDDLQRYKTVKGLRDQIMCSSRLCDLGFDRSVMIQEGETRERLEDARIDSKIARRSRR